MGDTGVDARRDAQFDYGADIDADGCASEVKGRDSEVLVFGQRNLVHLQRGIEGITRGTADKGDDGRRGGHGEGANAGRLGDGAVADVGVGVGAAEAGEVEAVGHLGRGGEPAVAQPADADAEVGPITRHRADQGAAFDAVGRVGHRLAGGHNRVEDAQSVIADKP